jgi:hypothetical protein
MAQYFEKNFNKNKSTDDSDILIIMADSHLVKKEFLNKLKNKFQKEMETKAEEDLKDPNIILAIRTENAVIGGSESSKLSTATTTSKSKKGKKSSASTKQTNDDSLSSVEITFIDKKSLIKLLEESVKELDEDLIEPLVDYFLK